MSLKSPSKYKLPFKETFSPLSIQKKTYDWLLTKYEEDYLHLNDKEINKLLAQYVAPIKLAGHPTGGVVDVTLIENGK